jgi:hypothetical protein
VSERFGYVRRFARTGEAWHIVQAPPTADGMQEDGPTLCGYRCPSVAWGTIVPRAEWMKVCSRCDRVRRRSEGA